jgi:hypothetical protein
MKSLLACLLVIVAVATPLSAHEIVIKGTVAAVDPARIQVKTGEERKGQEPTWFPIDAKTKILRGKQSMPFDQAKAAVGEPVTLVVFHESNAPLKTLEIRLPARTVR